MTVVQLMGLSWEADRETSSTQLPGSRLGSARRSTLGLRVALEKRVRVTIGFIAEDSPGEQPPPPETASRRRLRPAQ